jgi:hypothetical protein
VAETRDKAGFTKLPSGFESVDAMHGRGRKVRNVGGDGGCE